MTTVDLAAPRSSRRPVVVRVVVVAYAALTALVSFGLPSLALSWTTSGDELQLRTAYVVWGVLAGLLIPGLALSTWRSSVAALRGLAALVLGTVLAMALAFEPENLGYAAVIVGPSCLILALHPHTRRAFVRSPVDRFSAAIALVATVPGAWYGASLAAQSRATSYLDTMHGQYAQGAVLCFTLVLLGFVGALRQSGRLVIVLLASVSAAIWGVAGLLFPDDPMSMGSGWGVTTVVCAVIYALAATGDTRRSSVASE